MYNRILLATDGSEHSIRAAENAIKISKCSRNTKIDIVYVLDPNRAVSDALRNFALLV